MDLGRLTRDEHGGLFRSGRGDDPRKKRAERLSSGKRKITTTFARSVSEAEEGGEA